MTPIISANTQVPQIPHGQNNPLPAGFSTGSCFLWLKPKNTAFSMNIRGMVNHEYNRLLTEKGLVSDLIPGGEDLEQLGMDKHTSIVRPDLYLNACQKVISVHTRTPFDGLNLSTAIFFDLLHGRNVAHSANVRGLINQRYNELLFQTGTNEMKIPGHDLEQLGMDTDTVLNPELYAKAYGEVTALFEPTAEYAHCGPLGNLDLFNNALQFMGYRDIFVCARVCTSWNQFSQHLVIWQQFFKNEGIPFVEQGPNSNLKEEFRVLCPRTINRKMGERLFGNFREELPCISRQIFEKFYQEDPFEPGNLMMDTFQIVVIPSIIERPSCAGFSFILKEGNLTPTDNPTGETLKIPNGIKNLKILCEHPLSGKENMPVFGYFYNEILNQFNTYPDKISLCFMRTFIVGKNMYYLNQKALVEGHKFEVASLKDRVFFDAVCILTSGTCPDNQEPWSFARTSTAVVGGGNTYQTGIGSFAIGSGAIVGDCYCVHGDIGVALGVPAEVPR